jgi:hypothetical protein
LEKKIGRFFAQSLGLLFDFFPFCDGQSGLDLLFDQVAHLLHLCIILSLLCCLQNFACISQQGRGISIYVWIGLGLRIGGTGTLQAFFGPHFLQGSASRDK